AVCPSSSRFGELLLDLLQSYRVYRPAGLSEHKLDPAQYRLVDVHGKVHDLAGECLFEDRHKAQPQLSVVTVARHIDEAGHEALEGVAPHEQSDALALLQIQDPDRDIVQLVLADLEQFVARKGIEDVQQRLAVVALGRQPRPRNRALYLEAQQRDRARA